MDEATPPARPMAGFPPPPDARWTPETWDRPPFNRWSFQNIRAVLPTRAVPRGPEPSRLVRTPQPLLDLAFRDLDGQPTRLRRVLEESYTDGFLVLHRGRIALEYYANGMTERSLHLSQSVSKSFTGALLGILWGRGLVDLERPVQHYVPELAGCGYRDALLGQVADMRSGVRFVEDYDDPDCEVGQQERACGWKPLREGDPRSLYDLVLRLKQERPHGGYFAYRSIETDVLGWVLERVTGLGLPELLSRELWVPMGAEADGDMTVDRAGTAMASGGLDACLRDYARFGQLFLDEGFHNGRQIVPAEWVAGCRTGDRDAFAEKYGEYLPGSPNACYSRQWWVVEPARGRHVALGIYGQMIWIDPQDQLVVVKLSTWPTPLDRARRTTIFRACQAIGLALNGGGRRARSAAETAQSGAAPAR